MVEHLQHTDAVKVGVATASRRRTKYTFLDGTRRLGPQPELVIFHTPPPVVIGEAVKRVKVRRVECRDTTKEDLLVPGESVFGPRGWTCACAVRSCLSIARLAALPSTDLRGA